VVKRAYGQYCGFARALEVIGERWALMIVRDLLNSPKRFGELQRGLPGIPSNILTARLKEMEESGIVGRRILPRPSGAVVYELTDLGKGLEAAVIAIGCWGAKWVLGDPRPNEIITADSLMAALRSTFQPKAAKRAKATYELRAGDIVVHALVDNGEVAIGNGPLPDPDLVIEAGPGLRPLLARDVTPSEALSEHLIRITGERALLDQFVTHFCI
jgi:DNA-binding HxlR family transcriptional regulator